MIFIYFFKTVSFWGFDASVFASLLTAYIHRIHDLLIQIDFIFCVAFPINFWTYLIPFSKKISYPDPFLVSDFYIPVIPLAVSFSTLNPTSPFLPLSVGSAQLFYFASFGSLNPSLGFISTTYQFHECIFFVAVTQYAKVLICLKIF